MKKLSLYVFLLLMWCNVGVADDLKNFKIEDMTIGDSLLDYFSEEDIASKKKSNYPKSKTFYMISHDYLNKHDIFRYVYFHLKEGDKKYIIHSIKGLKFQKDIIKDCYNKLNEFAVMMSEQLKDAEIIGPVTKIIPSDKSGKSEGKAVYINLKSGNRIKMVCLNWSEEIEKQKKHLDNMSISIESKEYKIWIQNVIGLS